MGIPQDILRENPSLTDWCILSAYRGSIVHGTYTQNGIDDKDVMAVCVPPIDYYFGLKEFGSRGTKEIARDEWDIVIYELRKVINLLYQGNPNVLMLLWLQPNHYITIKDAGQMLLDNRDLFTGRHVYKAFVGYAYGQLHRMTHYGWQGFQGEKRKQMYENFGYDCKNASHLIRLLRMGTEFLKDGILNVTRHDAQQLLEIKNGEWTLEQVKTESDRWFKLAEESYLASTLLPVPDKKSIGELCVDMIRVHLGI